MAMLIVRDGGAWYVATAMPAADPSDLRASPAPTGRGSDRFAPLDAVSLSGDPEDMLGLMTALAAKVLAVPMAYVALLDGDRLTITGQLGLPAAVAGLGELGLERSVARVALAGHVPMFIDDLADHAALRDSNERVLLGAAAHASLPLELPGGEVVGTFCAADTVGRPWTARDEEILGDIAAAVAVILRNRERIRAAGAVAQLLDRIPEPVLSLTRQVRRLLAQVEGSTDPRTTQFASLTSGRIEAVEGLIRDAEVFTRRTAPATPGERRTADLTDVVERAVASAQAASGRMLANLEGPPAAILVTCDPLELERLLTALIVSLMRYTDHADDIRLRLQNRGDVGCLDITHVGRGVPIAAFTRMVTTFRLTGSRASAAIRMVDGTILAENGLVSGRSSGSETAFRISVPRA
jgi:GAF domain-containing protein